MVSQRGIEANPDQIKAIEDMESPSTIKEVQRLTGRLAALNRFPIQARLPMPPILQLAKSLKRLPVDPSV